MANHNAFIEKLREIVLENYTSEQFGVSDLVEQFGMSRSQLHRKLKAVTGQSVSQFIREIRLDEALKILQEEDVTASEVAYKVGFNSATYFNTCFNAYFGYPPGEVRHQMELAAFNSTSEDEPASSISKGKRILIWFVTISAIVLTVFLYQYFQREESTITESNIEEKAKTIAVLPFKNWSGDPELEYVSDGMTDAVIRRLTAISDIEKVVPFTTIIIYKNSDKSTSEIANELNVEYVLTGNFKLSGTEVMSNLDLIEVDSNDFLWSLEYKGIWDTDEIFSMQADVAENVAENMEVKVTSNEKDEINSILTDNEEAYRLYLKAEDQFSKLNKYGLENAVSLYEEAIAIDSNFVEPYAGLGRTYNVSGAVWGLLPEQVAWQKAKENFKTALKMDKLGSGYNINRINDQLVGGAFYYEYDIEQAEQHFQNTMRDEAGLNYRDYGFDYTRKSGRLEESMKIIEKEIKYYPVVGDGYMQKAFIMFMLGDKAAAVELLEALDPFSQDNYFYLLETSKWYYYMDEIDKSADHLEVILEHHDDRPPIVHWLSAIHGEITGDSDRVNTSLNSLHKQDEALSSGSPAWFIALYYCHIKDYDKTFEWLNTSYEKREVEMTWLMQEPMLKPLKRDPRYIDLYNKIGFNLIEPIPPIKD